MENDHIYVACITTKHAKSNPKCVALGSIVANCCKCNEEIYVSPNTVRLIDAKIKKTFTICLDCIQKEETDVHFLGPVPKNVEEVEKHIKTLEQNEQNVKTTN